MTKLSSTHRLLTLVIAIDNDGLNVLRRVEDGSMPLEVSQLLCERMARVHDDAVPFAAPGQEVGADGVELSEDGFNLGGVEGFARVGERGEFARRGEALRVAHGEDGEWDRHFEGVVVK